MLQMCFPVETLCQPFQWELNFLFTPTPVSHQQSAGNPLWTENSHLTHILGFIIRGFGWVRPQETKKTKNKNSKKKKKKAVSERNKITNYRNYRLILVPNFLLKHTTWNSPLPWTLPTPMGFRQLREALTKTISLWRWRRFWKLWMPKRPISATYEGSSAMNRESWHPLSKHWALTICQT